MMNLYSTPSPYFRFEKGSHYAKVAESSIAAKHQRPFFSALSFDRGKPFTDDAELAKACQFYEEGALSLGQAARFAGVSTETLIEHLGTRKVPVVNYPVEELDEELAVLSS
uniref:Uncharacterized protein n=1 Tax=Candidatus Kentrum sp. MB TaxID=2138164 RepID=A0A450XD33_9GAMM|nr:MAG: Uncharacterised protein family (UPF0175) [Candidatus Kentron sp. MB]VFK31026.1 MAG: Uncharacterised protein family (UPF0175) [Candidatus Kentron sp. MB]VFK75488.1 MAG: Uncharacterised protein family (UPF0175) [Candidatus Kentron sp. MB]